VLSLLTLRSLRLGARFSGLLLTQHLCVCARDFFLLALALTLLLASGCRQAEPPPAQRSFARVDEARVMAADTEPHNWYTTGRTFGEERYSPLDKINAGNVRDLGFAWDYDLKTERGLEATPVVVDGVMYTSSAWSRVYALDARTGAELWTYDPRVPGEWARNACCDVVNRGVAVWKGKVYVGTLDGRLIALDAETGKPFWESDTLIDRKRSYTITGAPRIAAGKVVIGNATFPHTTPPRASSRGASTPCRAIRSCRSSIRSSKSRPRRGIRRAVGKRAAAARRGIRWRTTRR
jgi:glucose dehydrogenase